MKKKNWMCFGASRESKMTANFSRNQRVKDKNHLHDSSLLDFIWGPPANLHIPSRCRFEGLGHGRPIW